ncbi:MAG: redoxin domain-containing protein [Candidatus Latescibacter sp.]|nr:redoxin domain-containing protein [Candidatus Latescibacter sp.]
MMRKRTVNAGLMLVVAVVTDFGFPTASLSQEIMNTKDNFIVYEANGPRSFILSRARGNFVALHFLLKTTCPYCMKHTYEYAVRAHEVPGVHHVFLKPDTDEEIKAWSGLMDASYAVKTDSSCYVPPIIYRDPDAALAIVFAIPTGYAFHNQVVNYPALVILDPYGKEVFRYVGKSNADRYTFDQFITKMTELRKQAQSK